MKNLCLLVVAILFAVTSIFAQSPELFKYQAVLRDVSGNAIASAAKTVVINVLQTSAAGTSVYQETHSITTTPQGIINLNIGGGTVNSGVFANINWSAYNYFIKVSVDGVDISTGQLLSVPYALYAKSSGNATIQVLTQDQRDALTPTTGLMVLNTTTNKLNVYNGTTWLSYDGAAAATVKLDPTITWANPANIVEGTLLSATQLNASASVAGAYVYTPAIGTALSVGASQNLTVNFTPTDAAHYNLANKTVTINVIAKTTPTITWANPANAFVGTALSATQLNASASVAGTYVYTPAIGTVLSLGDAQNLTVDFTPTDATNYTTATKTVTINVTKQTPTIAWANPANIFVGTALSATQLNASASVAGSYVYTPAIGTVLSLGDVQNLTVNFTPTDATNYTTATKTVTINVKSADPTDGDGNVYIPVIIGSQTWLKPNIKTKKFNDGSLIPTDRYFIYGQSSNTGNPDPYGYLYTASAILDASKNVCPIGYHIPTSTEWGTLVGYLGTSVAGGRMKSSISYWAQPNAGAHDSGFDAYPGGTRDRNGNYSDVFNYAYIWSIDGYFIYMAAGYQSANVSPTDYQSSFSVRCLKN